VSVSRETGDSSLSRPCRGSAERNDTAPRPLTGRRRSGRLCGLRRGATPAHGTGGRKGRVKRRTPHRPYRGCPPERDHAPLQAGAADGWRGVVRGTALVTPSRRVPKTERADGRCVLLGNRGGRGDRFGLAHSNSQFVTRGHHTQQQDPCGGHLLWGCGSFYL
jgi:hypothetical protein